MAARRATEVSGNGSDESTRASLGQVIKQARERRNWSQVELARAADLSPSAVAKAELGQRSLKRSNLIRVCQALGLDLQSVLPVAGFSSEVAAETIAEPSGIGDIGPVIRTEIVKVDYIGGNTDKGVYAEVRGYLVNPAFSGHCRSAYSCIQFDVLEQSLILSEMNQGAAYEWLDGRPYLSETENRIRVLEKMNAIRRQAEKSCVDEAEASVVAKLKDIYQIQTTGGLTNDHEAENFTNILRRISSQYAEQFRSACVLPEHVVLAFSMCVNELESISGDSTWGKYSADDYSALLKVKEFTEKTYPDFLLSVPKRLADLFKKHSIAYERPAKGRAFCRCSYELLAGISDRVGPTPIIAASLIVDSIRNSEPTIIEDVSDDVVRAVVNISDNHSERRCLDRCNIVAYLADMTALYDLSERLGGYLDAHDQQIKFS